MVGVFVVDADFEPAAVRDAAAREVRAFGADDEAVADDAVSTVWAVPPEPGPEVSSDAVEPASPDPTASALLVRPLPPRRRRRRFGAADSPEAPSSLVWFVDGPASAGGAAMDVVNGSSLTCGPSLLGPRSARWGGRWSANASRPEGRVMAK